MVDAPGSLALKAALWTSSQLPASCCCCLCLQDSQLHAPQPRGPAPSRTTQRAQHSSPAPPCQRPFAFKVSACWLLHSLVTAVDIACAADSTPAFTWVPASASCFPVSALVCICMCRWKSSTLTSFCLAGACQQCCVISLQCQAARMLCYPSHYTCSLPRVSQVDDVCLLRAAYQRPSLTGETGEAELFKSTSLAAPQGQQLLASGSEASSGGMSFGGAASTGRPSAGSMVLTASDMSELLRPFQVHLCSAAAAAAVRQRDRHCQAGYPIHNPTHTPPLSLDTVT